MDETVMYRSDEVECTLDDVFLTDALRGARTRELEFLQRELFALHAAFQVPLNVFDIGIGDGYVPVHFERELWTRLETYVGIDNSARELERCGKNVRQTGLNHKVRTFAFDATHLNDQAFRQKLPSPLHAVVCTYFTAGNFKPDEIRAEEGPSGRILPYSQAALRPNRVFQRVFFEAYQLLCHGGKLILGSTYMDSPATREKQEAFYEKCGMRVITTNEDTFTATREGFWSQRFTDEVFRTYLDWIPSEDVEFIPLDAEEFARMVVITKR